jgi:micrococcal nuclease
MRRSAKVVPVRHRRWPPRWWYRLKLRLGPGSPPGAAAFWFAAFAVVAGGYAAVAPLADDWRSARRAMVPECRVARVLDGDTVDLVCPGRRGIRARIVGYDAPELFSPRCTVEREAAVKAKRALGAWVMHATRTEVAFLGTDRYGRALVDMRLSGQRVATAMVASGSGRRYFGHLRGGWCG